MNTSIHNRRYRNNNPEKRLAHSKVNWAIRTGKLTKMPCEKCGTEPAHAHHDDYSKPLEVRWLCHQCHEIEHHGEIGKKRVYSKEKSRARYVAYRLANPLQPTHKQANAASALEMRRTGASYSKIAQHFGISKATAFKWVNKPDYE